MILKRARAVACRVCLLSWVAAAIAAPAAAQSPTFDLEGVVTDVSYLGGLTVYKVKLDSGAIVRSSMANTARIDIDAYSLSQRVVAWFTPDDCMVLER